MNSENDVVLYQLERSIISTKKSEITLKKLKKYFSVFNSLDAEYREQNKSRIEYLLIDSLSKYDIDNTDDDYEELGKTVRMMIDFVATISDLSSNEKESSGALVYFLHSLLINEYGGLESKLYRKLSSTINDVSWLFKLKIDDKNIFPVHELIVEVAEKFEYNNDNLLHLTMALQIFKDIDEEFKCSESENKIRKIAAQYNIGILDCLINSGSLLCYSDINYKLNSTLIARNDKYIIIRNKSREYFSGCNNSILKEINENNEEMCYFVKIEIEPSWRIIDFKKFMLESRKDEKRRFLSTIIKTKNYNFLYGELIIVENDSNTFVRLVNESNRDSNICFKEKSFENTFDGFYEAIVSNCIEDVRTSLIYGDSDKCDVVTFDYALAIFKYLNTQIYKYDWLACNYEKRTNTYQYEIIRLLFEHVKQNYSFNMFCGLFEKYYNLLNENMLINAESTIHQIKHITLPFLPYMPFENREQLIDWISEKEEYCDNTLITRIEIKDEKLGKEIFDDKGNNITGFTDSELILSSYDVADCYVVVDYDNKNIYIDENLDKSINIQNQLVKFRDYIAYDDVCKINTRLVQMIKLIKGSQIRFENLNKFNIVELESENIICLYKLLWHFRIYSIYGEKIFKFYTLVLDYHHTDSILIEEDWITFFDAILEMMKIQGTLIIAKESSGDSGTLFTKYNDYVRRKLQGTRGNLYEIFDAVVIQNQISIDENANFAYRGEKINKIIFVTDNITRGAATRQLLKYHCEGIKEDSNKKFLKFEETREIKKIIATNCIEDSNIEVYALYCLEGNDVVEFEDGRIFKINRMREIGCKYILDDNISQLYKEVYGVEPNAHPGILCIIRCNNMPKKTVFDEKIINTIYIGGLFTRKNENVYDTYAGL